MLNLRALLLIYTLYVSKYHSEDISPLYVNILKFIINYVAACF